MKVLSFPVQNVIIKLQEKTLLKVTIKINIKDVTKRIILLILCNMLEKSYIPEIIIISKGFVIFVSYPRDSLFVSEGC